MKTKINFPDIYSYNDFKLYLRDYQIERYKVDPTFTKTTASKLLGMPNTRSIFNEVISGRRKLTPSLIDRFVKLLESGTDESNYFRTLVRYNQADSVVDKELYFEQLLEVNKSPHITLSKETYHYFNEWHNIVIRALLDIIDISDNCSSLVLRILPEITVQQAQKSIELLERLGLIKRNEQGFYKPTDKVIATPEYIQNELLHKYQMRCLKAAYELASLESNQPSHLSTNMISISEKGYKQLQKEIDKFRAKVRSVLQKDQDPAESIYQICIAAMPVSRKEK